MAVLSWRQSRKDVPSSLGFCLDFLVQVLAETGQPRQRGIDILAAGKWTLRLFLNHRSLFPSFAGVNSDVVPWFCCCNR